MILSQILENGFTQGLIFSLVVMSLSLSYRLLKFPDISIEGTFALSAAVFGVLVSNNNSFIIAATAALISCVVMGSMTAMLHHYLRINKFLSGILIVTASYSIIARVIGGSNVSLLDFNLSVQGLFLWILIAVGLSVTAFLFYHSVKGIQIRGSALNPELSRSLGYKTGGLLIAGLSFNNIFAGMSGIMFATDAGFSDLKIGQGILITALAALSIGEAIVPQRKVSLLLYCILSSFIGSIAYQILWAAALQFDIRPSDLKLLSALIVIALFLIRKKKDTGDEL
ncbi:MAG: hypothetical protein HOP10_03095 [Chitinophagaceae bacterium]|nr:hypothetical protein [Chitinophagaceae bacterium]